MPSIPAGKDGSSQCFCAFSPTVNVSQRGTSHGQEDFSDVHFKFFFLLILSCWLIAAARALFHPVWIICMLTHWVKPVLTAGVCSAAFKEIISFVDQLYHSPPKALQFAYVFSVYIPLDGPLYLRKYKLYCNRCRQRWAGSDKGNGVSTWGETRRVCWFSLQKWRPHRLKRIIKAEEIQHKWPWVCLS